MTARPANADRGGHTVEKIGGTSMSRTPELVDTIFGGDRPPQDRYGRIFVVSAYGGVTDLLLEHKKSGEAGVYARFTDTEDAYGWSAALTTVAERMRAINAAILDDPGDRRDADAFVRERIEGARNCLIDLERLCSYGHFQVAQHLLTVRELLAGLGEAHAAYGTVLVLRRRGINARFVDLSGWRDETHPSLDERLAGAFAEIDLTREMPVVTGYAQCREGLMRAFDRGYTEVTFARLAALTGAREAVIHKEFHLSSADPAIVGGDKVVKIGRTNYDVADQLSNMG
ncbi:MAG: aspartate kinase, partial [Geminicoccaceae bacterium]|nr:aspartate kinase [Geminicoccaceae bacterium]